MSFGIWSRTVRDGEGNVIDDAEVEVREVQDPDNAEASPITLATIYDDFGGTTEKSNPFTVDGDGRAEFYADGDFYHVIVSRDGVDAVYLNQQLGTAQARDLVVGADGNVPAWDADGNLVDSGQAAADIGSGGGASALDDLSDVTITSPADDDLLAYDSGSSEFINQSKSEAGFGDAATKGVTGADANTVTGTAGTSGNLGEWNDDGDLVDTGIASSAVFTQSSDVDHDQTTGFVANEHVDHSTVNVNSGDGLTGGGNLTATRTLSLDPAGATAATIAGDDDVLFGDTSNGGAVRRATAQEIADLGGGGAIVFEPPVSSDPDVVESVESGPDEGVSAQVATDGVLVSDGRLILVPTTNDIYAITPSDQSIAVVETATFAGEDFRWGALASDGRVVFAPRDRSAVGLFDPDTDTYSDGPTHGEGGDAFWGAATVNDGRTILAPHDSANVGIFDPADDSYTSGPAHGDVTDFAFSGAVHTDDDRVVFVPWDAASVGVFDPADDSYTAAASHGEGGFAFRGGAKADDGRIIFAPYNSTNVGIFDPSTDTYSSGPAHGQTTPAFQGAAKAGNGLIIFPPDGSDVWGVFDPSDDSFRTISALTTGTSRFFSATADADGRVWGITEDNDTFDYYQPPESDAYAIDFGEDVPDGYVAQGWFQPNETTTPTLRNTGGEPSTAIPIVNRDGSDLAIGALDGAHRVYRDGASPDVWYLLDPVTLDPANIESGGAGDGDVLTWDASAEQWAPDAPSGGGGEAFPLDPENATDTGTDTYESETTTTPPNDGEVIYRDFQSANTTTAPTLDSLTITTKDGSALWANALEGVHTLQLASGGGSWLVLDPNPSIQGDPVARLDTFTRGHIDGLELSNNSTDSDHDIDIATGVCSMRDDAGNRKLFELTSAITKQIDANWAEGTDAGGFPSGLTLSADTHYNVFLIGKDDGAVDAGFDTDASAANLLADASTYSWFRRIGSIFTDGGSNIRPFTQLGDFFRFNNKQKDVDDGAGTLGSFAAASVTCPPNQVADLVLFGSVQSATNIQIFVAGKEGDEGTELEDRQASFRLNSVSEQSLDTSGVTRVVVDGNGQIRYAMNSTNGAWNRLVIGMKGWTDDRGRDI